MSGRALAWVIAAVLGCAKVEPTPIVEHTVKVVGSAEARPIVASIPEHPACELVEPPAGMIDLGEVIPDAILVAGYHRTDNFTGRPLPGYEAPGAWLEREAATALARAAERLARADLRLILYDAYRPRSASEAMVAWARAAGREDLLDDGWIARRSAHNRGRAIDLGLADRQGIALDMGSDWDQFDRRSHLRGVGGQALEHRLILRAAMVEAGFVPYEREWWHFGFRSQVPAPIRDQPYTCSAL